jgi:RNA polymerase sigma factor (sigma-70 family)
MENFVNTSANNIIYSEEKNIDEKAFLDTIISGCMEKKRSAQEVLYKKYYGKMMGLCLRYFKNKEDAKDAMNMGFLKVFKNIHLFDKEKNLDAWIYTIIQRTALDLVRKQVKIKNIETEITEKSASIEPEILQQLYVQDLMLLLNQLPDTSRLVFTLYAIENFKHHEIAEELSISEGTSKWHVNHAKKILKELILNQNAKKP